MALELRTLIMIPKKQNKCSCYWEDCFTADRQIDNVKASV